MKTILRYSFPLLLLGTVLFFLWMGLDKDPHEIPSALLNRSLPAFDLSQLFEPSQKFTKQTLEGQVALINVWASWCEACQLEQPVLMQISKEIPVYGIDYKDVRSKAKAYLAQYGNPYKVIGYDPKGFAAIDFGVYGTPETYLVDSRGIIRYKHIGPMTEEVWEKTIKPLIQKGFT